MKCLLRNIVLLLTVAISLILYSCDPNHGDIGYFYGQWSLRALSVDGEDEDIDVKLYFWKFQNDIIEIQKFLDFLDCNICLGTWREEENELFLNFDHKEIIDGEENYVRYTPPAELGIPGRTTSIMHIEKLTSSDMVLRFERSDGKVYRYTFKKLI